MFLQDLQQFQQKDIINNLSYTTVNKSSDHFVAKSYTGNGGTINVTGMNFAPDFSWLKCKDIGYNHALFDTLRGASQRLATNLTGAQVNASGEGITSFNSDGYTVVQGTTLEYGNNGIGYASWNWKAGGSASSNSDGSVTANLSANATAGFSISTFTSESQFGLDLFANSLKDYIYLNPTGEEINEMPVYNYVQDDANLFGGELYYNRQSSLDWLSYETSVEFLRGEKSNSDVLPYISPLTLKQSFNLEFNNSSFELEAVLKGKKENVAQFETKTDSYFL